MPRAVWLRALWAEERDTSQPDVRVAVANENGFDGARLLDMEAAGSTQAIYQSFSQDAIDAGVFGAPIFVLKGERFWGQDRLMFLERALAKAAAR